MYICSSYSHLLRYLPDPKLNQFSAPMKRQLLLVMVLLLSNAIFASTEKTSMQDLPIVLQYRISQNFGKDDSAYHIKKTDPGYTAVNHLNGVTGLISEKGLQVRVKGFTWSLLLKGLNSGGHLMKITV